MSLLSTADPWNTVAEGYAAVTRNLFRTYSEMALERVPLKAGDRVADIACGPGTLTELAVAQAAEVTAVDFSDKMIAALEASLPAFQRSKVRTLVGDGQALDLPDDGFDAAFSMFGLIFFPDRARGFSELNRILRPGGTACVSSWAPVSASPLLSAMFGTLKLLNPDLEDPKYDVESLENPEILKAEMQQAGFQDVHVYPVQGWSEFASARQLWQDMVAGSAPLAVMRSRTPDAAWQQLSEKAIAHLAKTAGPFPNQFSAKAFLGIGHTPMEVSND